MSTSHLERLLAGLIALAVISLICVLAVVLLYKPIVVVSFVAVLVCCYVVGSVILLRSKIKRNI